MGNSSSQPETGASQEHDVLLTDYDIPPPPYENAYLSVSDEEGKLHSFHANTRYNKY